MPVMLPIDDEADVAVALDSRIVPREVMTTWVELADLPAWVEAYRARRMAAVDEELAQWAEDRRSAIGEELERTLAEQDAAARRSHVQAATALRGQASALASAMADVATACVREVLADALRAGEFQAIVLRRLLPHLEDLPTITVHLPPAGLAQARLLLAEMFASPQLVVDIVPDERLAETQCIVRCGDRMYEAGFDTWLSDVRNAMLLTAQAHGFPEAAAPDEEPHGDDPRDEAQAPDPSGREQDEFEDDDEDDDDDGFLSAETDFARPAWGAR